MLVWGVQPLLLEEFTSIDAMIKAAIDLASKKGVVRPGNKVVIVAAAPSAPPGQTDFLRVATLNDLP
jgi:pyruvate kinase